MASSTAENPQESYTPENRNLSGMEVVFSPLAPCFQSRAGDQAKNYPAQHEPRTGDVAPTPIGTGLEEEWLMNLRLNSTDLTEDVDHSGAQNYFLGGPKPESLASSGLWGDNPGISSSGARNNGDMIDTFDFLVKSLSSANNYVSMLTREQLSVLRSIRPSLLYEFLQEVAKVRSDKRLRRAMPNECAFCKNNGENEECYSSHALKDWRGRVLCPVLRAFRCPRCSATGDRAHTIKYCPENGDNGLERSGSFTSRRRASSSTSSLLFGGGPQHPGTSSVPSPSPATASFSHSSVWNPYM